MKVDKLYLENFRNYKNQVFEFNDNLNIIYGLNGQGKTNVIEALYFFCNGKSYRSSHDTEVINFLSDYANIKCEFTAQGEKQNAQIFIDKKKVIKINGAPIQKLSEIIGMLNMVIFTPEQLNLIKNGPGERRKFIDIFVSQLKPLYFKTLLNYYKVLAQRNNILKSKNKAMLSTIDIWNEKLAELGVLLCKYRNETIDLLNLYVNDINFENKEKIDIKYLSNIKNDFTDKGEFIKQLEAGFERDVDKQMTMTGPHRDDIDILMNNKSIKKYGSQGQQRTCVLKMKLSECDILNKVTGEQPILLLDDILSELDNKRKTFFLENIKERQVIITATQKEIFKGECTYFKIENGNMINKN